MYFMNYLRFQHDSASGGRQSAGGEKDTSDSAPGTDEKHRETSSKNLEDVSSPEPSEKAAAATSGKKKQERKSTDMKKWQLADFDVRAVTGKFRFHDIGLPEVLMHGIAEAGFEYCTPVQAESLPHLLKGEDLVANANTGTGKTAVFLIAVITTLLQNKKVKGKAMPRALVIAPTRELVIQITKDGERLSQYCDMEIAAVYGGTDYQKQMDQLRRRGADIVVATPGRLLDFCGKRILDLSRVEILVIDEADRMLDMGFIPDVRRIVGRLPDKKSRQTLMFSATITEDVKRLADQWCRNPVNVAIEPEQVAVQSVDQKVYLVTSEEKYPILYNIITNEQSGRMLVFANQKVEAKNLYERLRRNGIDCTLLTGDVPQNKRTQRLESFRSGKIEVLVATDVAGRGIHVEGITHVVNYTLPYEPEDYVHRIGRTGRAGAAGVSISFACEKGSFMLPDIEEFIGRKLECFPPEEDLLAEPPKPIAPPPRSVKRGKRKKRPHRARGAGKKKE